MKVLTYNVMYSGVQVECGDRYVDQVSVGG